MVELVEKIRLAYERDQARGFTPVHSASELPKSFEEITDDWLTDALCRNASGARVVGHTLGDVDNGSSNRRRIQVVYNEAGREARLPTAFFCKATHDLANRTVLGISGGADCEMKFYKDIRPELNIEAPVGFYARFDPETFNSLVILADITDEVTAFCNHKTEMSRQRAESQMRNLAAMHGAGYSVEKVRRDMAEFPSWPEYFENTQAFGMREGSEQGFLMAEGVIPARLHRRHAEIWPATMASVEAHNRLPMTFAHGDVHLKNWYIAGNGEMGLSDWQCAHRGHWARDVAYAVATALTIEDRRAWERELLAYYLDQLAAAGGPRVGFDEAFTHYRQQLVTALTWWTITLNPTPDIPDMQPRDTTEEFIRRIATAMDDLDSLGAFAG